jgi:hypothetical protein
MRDQVSHPYKTTGRLTVLYTFTSHSTGIQKCMMIYILVSRP